jgi:hypothetical protein
LLAITSTPIPTQAATVAPVRAGGSPPIELTLPEGWQAAFGRVPVRTAFEEQLMNIAIYRGPAPNSVGNVVVMWGFPSIAPPITGNATPVAGAANPLTTQMLWTDGLRLLQGTLVDITCNVGTAGQKEFTLGALKGVGTYFNINNCQGEPDTAGWFVGVEVEGRRYLVYAYIEPVEAYNDGRALLQTILDSIRFVPVVTATPKP